MKLRIGCVSVAGCLCLCANVMAQTTAPVFYAWSSSSPGWAAQSDSLLNHPAETFDLGFDATEMVRIYVDSPNVPVYIEAADVADAVVNEIVRRMSLPTPSLRSDRVCIALQRFGTSTASHPDALLLFGHARDGNPGNPMSSWINDSIDVHRDWMTEFCTQYKARQLVTPSIPNPARFHFDSEFGGIGGTGDTAVVSAYLAMTSDGRWSTEPIPGLSGDAAGTPMTLDQRYRADAAARGWDPDHPELICDDSYIPRHPVNRLWFVWWSGLHLQTAEGAMKEAVYEIVADSTLGWPGCQVSNYEYSASSDGTPSPYVNSSGLPFPNAIPTRNSYDAPLWDLDPSGEAYFLTHWRGYGSRMAPVLYDACADNIGTGPFAATGETQWDATLRYHRYMLDACISSFGGGHQGRMAPWITLPTHHFTTGCAVPIGGFVTHDNALQQLALLRAKDVDEILLWWNAQNPYWNQDNVLPVPPSNPHVDAALANLRQIYFDTYDSVLSSLAVTTGTRVPACGSGCSDPSPLYFALHETLGVQANSSGIAAITVDGLGLRSNALATGFGVQVNLEYDANFADTVPTVVLATGMAPMAPNKIAVNGDRVIASFVFPDGFRSVNCFGEFSIGVEVQHATAGSALTCDFDLVQAIRLPTVCGADLDDGSGMGIPDGNIDINDLLYFLGAFEGGDPGADIDDGGRCGHRDGGVDINDLLYFLERFEGGC